MNRQSTTLYFNLDISHEQCLLYYQGTIHHVMVTTDDNIKIQFPAQFIHKFVRQDGVRGRFRLVFDENNKLLSLDRINVRTE